MTAALLIRAAQLLELGAEELKRSHTLAGGEWPEDDDADVQAQINHNEMIKIARGLREREQADLRFANELSRAFNSGDGGYRP